MRTGLGVVPSPNTTTIRVDLRPSLSVYISMASVLVYGVSASVLLTANIDVLINDEYRLDSVCISKRT